MHEVCFCNFPQVSVLKRSAAECDRVPLLFRNCRYMWVSVPSVRSSWASNNIYSASRSFRVERQRSFNVERAQASLHDATRNCCRHTLFCSSQCYWFQQINGKCVVWKTEVVMIVHRFQTDTTNYVQHRQIALDEHRLEKKRSLLTRRWVLMKNVVCIVHLIRSLDRYVVLLPHVVQSEMAVQHASCSPLVRRSLRSTSKFPQVNSITTHVDRLRWSGWQQAVGWLSIVIEIFRVYLS